jgi:hypothetical protein
MSSAPDAAPLPLTARLRQGKRQHLFSPMRRIGSNRDVSTVTDNPKAIGLSRLQHHHSSHCLVMGRKRATRRKTFYHLGTQPTEGKQRDHRKRTARGGEQPARD